MNTVVNSFPFNIEGAANDYIHIAVLKEDIPLCNKTLDYHTRKESNANDVFIRMIKSKVNVGPSVSQYHFS